MASCAFRGMRKDMFLKRASGDVVELAVKRLSIAMCRIAKLESAV